MNMVVERRIFGLFVPKQNTKSFGYDRRPDLGDNR